MKKTFIRLLAVVLCALCAASVLFCLPVFATTDRVVDNADLLDASEESDLRAKLDSMSAEYGVDVVVVTTSSLNGKYIRDYADDYYDYHDYGENGILLVRYINGSNRDVWISTKGVGIRVMTDYDIQRVFDRMEPYCDRGDQPGALFAFADGVLAELIDYETYGEQAPSFDPMNIFAGLIIGLIVALIVTGSMKKKLKTVKPQPYAGNYIRPGSFNLNVCRDIYLYRTVSRVRRESSSSSRGGSSTHRSSSGASHGGGGRHM